MKSLSLTVLALALVLTGCGNKEREKSAVRIGRGGTAIAPGTNNQYVSPGSPYTRVLGEVTGASEQTVKALLNASMDAENPENFRSPVAGIVMSGDIRLSGSTQNVLALGSSTATIVSGSEFALSIIDDIALNDGQSAITISFKPGGNNGYQVQGQISNGGQANIVFQDSYGQIILTGTYNSSEFRGTISFKNSQKSAVGQQITLGQFRVPTCGFFHCQ